MTPREAMDLLRTAQASIRTIKSVELLDHATGIGMTSYTKCAMRLSAAEAYLLTVDDSLTAAIGEIDDLVNTVATAKAVEEVAR